MMCDPIKESRPITFASLYVQPSKKTSDNSQIHKIDRTVLQRLIIAYEAGRSVDLRKIMRHELMPVPV